MSQHDHVIADADGATFLADLNAMAGAIATNNSGASAPATTYAHMWWPDTTSGWLKQRNAANSDWEPKFPISKVRVDVASAATLDLDANAVTSDYLRITGTITVPAVTLAAGQRRIAVAGGAFQLTNSASLIVQGGDDYTTTEGDLLMFLGEAGGVVRVAILKADGTAVVSSSGGGMKNRLINGAMAIDQRNAGAAKTFTASAALAYCVDRWYGYCTGANVTGQRVSGTAPNQYNYRFTGAASVTKIGFAQRIEAVNCQDLAGQTATLSVDLANSLLTTVTWTAWYANTADTFGTLASPTRTQIATGTFTVDSTLTRYSTQISIPSGATTGIELELSVGAQTSGTWTVGRAQIEIGAAATAFEARQIGAELALCQRYCHAFSSYSLGRARDSDTLQNGTVSLGTTMRAVPIMLGGASFAVSTGSSGTPEMQNTTGSIPSTDAVPIRNSAASWTTGALVAVTATFEAEL